MPRIILGLKYDMGEYPEEDLPENWDDPEWWNDVFFQKDVVVGDMDIESVMKLG